MEETKGIRINQYLSRAGVCARRQADVLIEAGHVRINGRPAQIGQLVQPGDTVTCEGKPVQPKQKPVLLMLHKPEGIECTADPANPDNVIAFVSYPSRLFYVGRLDKRSSGLLLLTNDGTFANDLQRAANYHEKEYVVTVDKEITGSFLQNMRQGVHLTAKRNGETVLDAVTRPCKVKQTGKKTFQIILTQGLNRQIRRMCETLGYRVVKLKRIRILNLELGTLAEGEWKEVPPEIWEKMKQDMKRDGKPRRRSGVEET